MKKILHISKYYPPYRGGIEDVCFNIVNCLTKDFEQKVLCFNKDSSYKNEWCDNVEIIRLPIWKEIFRQPICFRYYYSLKKTLKEFNPDILHLHLPNPLVCFYLLVLSLRGKKIILHWHSDIVVNPKLYCFFKFIENKILRKADKILVTSPNYMEFSFPLKKYHNKCIVVPNAIEKSKFELNENDKKEIENIKSKHKKIIFFLGRHVEYKGIQCLIEAEKHISSECSIFIGGVGPLTESLKNEVFSYRIAFLGKIPEKDIKIWMHAADIFAFPSITKNEAFGVALAEAMYCRSVPVTFTIKGSGVNWVNMNGMTGIEVDNKDSKEYGLAIDTLLQDDELRNRYAENAYQRVEKLFTMKKFKKQIIELYAAMFP